MSGKLFIDHFKLEEYGMMYMSDEERGRTVISLNFSDQCRNIIQEKMEEYKLIIKKLGVSFVNPINLTFTIDMNINLYIIRITLNELRQLFS